MEKNICPACCGSGTDYKNNGDPDESRWDCPTCNGTGEAAARILKDLAEEDPLAAALLHEAMEEGRASIPPDTIPCPNCDGAGEYLRPEYESSGTCVGQYSEACARCEGSGQIPKPSPPKRDDFRCPEHGQPVTGHVAVPEGGYRRVCPECPPVANVEAHVAECNAARKARRMRAYMLRLKASRIEREAARNEQRK